MATDTSSDAAWNSGSLTRFRAEGASEGGRSKAKQAGLRLFSRLVQSPASSSAAAASGGGGKAGHALSTGALGGIVATLARSQSLGLFQEISPPRNFVVQPVPLPSGSEAFANVSPSAAANVLTADRETHWANSRGVSVLGINLGEPAVVSGVRVQFKCDVGAPDDAPSAGALTASLPSRMEVQVRLAPSSAGGKPSKWITVATAKEESAGTDSDSDSDSGAESDGSGDDKASAAGAAAAADATVSGGEAAPADGAAASADTGAAATPAAASAGRAALEAPSCWTADNASEVAASSKAHALAAPSEAFAPVDITFGGSARIAAIRIRFRGSFPAPYGASSSSETAVSRLQLLQIPDERSAPSALSSLAAVRTWLVQAVDDALAAGGDGAAARASAPIQALADLARASGAVVDVLTLAAALRRLGDAPLGSAVSAAVDRLVLAVDGARDAVARRTTAEELVGRSIGAASASGSWGDLEAKWRKGKGFDTSSLELSEGDTLVHSKSSPTVQVATAGPFRSGKAEWSFKLVEDSTSMCSCFGFVRLPIADGNYEHSEDQWMVRAYNGRRYSAGTTSDPPSALGDSAKVNKGDTIRFVVDFEAGAGGEAHGFINGKPVGICFKGFRGQAIYPAVAFYSSGRKVRILSVKGPRDAAGSGAGAGGDDDDGDASVSAALAAAGEAGRRALMRAAGRRGAGSRRGDAPGLGASAGDAHTGDGFLPQQDVRAALRSGAGTVLEGTMGVPGLDGKALAAAEAAAPANDADDEEDDEPAAGAAAADSGLSESKTSEAAAAAATGDDDDDDNFPESDLGLDAAPTVFAFAGGHAAAPAAPLLQAEWGVVGRLGGRPGKPVSSDGVALAAAALTGGKVSVSKAEGGSLALPSSIALVCPSQAETEALHGAAPAEDDAEAAAVEARIAAVTDDAAAAAAARPALAERRGLAWDSRGAAFAYLAVDLGGRYLRFETGLAVDSSVLKRPTGADAESDDEDAPSRLSSLRVVFEVVGDGVVLDRFEAPAAKPGSAVPHSISVSVVGVRRLAVRAWSGSAALHRVTAVFTAPTLRPCTDWACAGWRNDRSAIRCAVWGVPRGEGPRAAGAEPAPHAGPAGSAAAASFAVLDAAGLLARDFCREMRLFGPARPASGVTPWPLESPFAVDTSPASLFAVADAISAAVDAAAAAGAAPWTLPAASRAVDVALACVRRLVVSRVALDEADSIARASGEALRRAGAKASAAALSTLRERLQAASACAALSGTAAAASADAALAALALMAPPAPDWTGVLAPAGAGALTLELELPWPSCVVGRAGASTAAFGGSFDGGCGAAAGISESSAKDDTFGIEAAADEKAAADDDDDSEGEGEVDESDAAAVAKRDRKLRGLWRALGRASACPTDPAILLLAAGCAARGWECRNVMVWPARAFVIVTVPSPDDAAAFLAADGLLSAALASIGVPDWTPGRGSALIGATVRHAPTAGWDRRSTMALDSSVAIRVYGAAAGGADAVEGAILSQLTPEA